MEIRYIPPDATVWESWRIPSDKGHRDQLRRIVGEWQAQQQLLSELATIDPDIPRALAKVLQSHELLSRATVTMTVAIAQSPLENTPAEEEPEETEFEFEDSVEC